MTQKDTRAARAWLFPALVVAAVLVLVWIGFIYAHQHQHLSAAQIRRDQTHDGTGSAIPRTPPTP